MTRVQLPPGCMGFRAQDGTRYVAKPGTSVDVADHHMAALKNNDYAQAGLVDAGAEKFIVNGGTEGMWCAGQGTPQHQPKMWYQWHKACPKCGDATIPESELVLPVLEKYIP
jgi:hypothetical protein